MNTLTTCPVCKSENIKFKYKVPDRHYGIKGEFTLYKCSNCGLVFLNPMYDDQELSKFYPEDSYYSYYANFDKGEKKFKLSHLIYKIVTFSFFDRKIEKSDGGKVLDIGCGNGWVIYEYKKKGWRVAGLEPSKIAAEIGNTENLNIYNGTLLEAKYPDKEFDLILSNHSFEHIYNPHEVLSEVYRILKDNGKIILGIPNYGGIVSRLSGKYWYYLGAPVHTFNYSTGNIKRLLAQHGFRAIKTSYVSMPLGILGSIQIFANRKNGQKSSDGKWVNSAPLKFCVNYLAKLFNLFRVGDCIELTIVKNSAIGTIVK